MATGRISKSTVDGLQASPKDRFLWDDKLAGFGVKVTPTGSKVYLYQYRIGGRGALVRRFTIGKHGTLTPDMARKQAERLGMLRAQGIDPQSEKVTRARQAVDFAFDKYCARFVEDCLKQKWKASYASADAHLRLHAIPFLGNKPIPDIGRADILAVLNPVRNQIATASYLYAVLRRLFRWAVSQGDLTRSPMEGMEPPPLPITRDRVLDDAELAAVWKASQGLGYPFGAFTRLLIITGARRQEVAGLEWNELDRANSMWSLPAHRAKNGLAAQLPLSNMAVMELDALASRTAKSDFWPRKGLVLSTTGTTSISGYSRAKTRLDLLMFKTGIRESEQFPLRPWRFHDLRRTVATGLQRLGVRFEVTEAILNHVSGSRSGVAGIYQRHDWAMEKRLALTAWSDHLAAEVAEIDKPKTRPLTSTRE